MNGVQCSWSKDKFFLCKNVQVNSKNFRTFQTEQWRNCITYQGKQNGSVLLTNEQCTEQSEQTQTLPIQDVWTAQQILPKIVSTFECIDGETISFA